MEYRRGNKKKDNPEKLATQGTQSRETGNIGYTIQRNWQHREHNTEKNKTKTQHDMCWTPLNTNNVNKTCAHIQTTGVKTI